MVTRKRLPPKERKKFIRQGAKKVFLKKGFRNTTMEDVIDEVQMSKGGVYHYYKSTWEMLHDLLMDGNQYRIDLAGDFAKLHRMRNPLEVLVEAIVQKITDENEYKSIYAMFLIEAKENPELARLEKQLKADSMNQVREVFIENNMEEYLELINEDLVIFLDSFIVAGELLHLHEDYQRNKSFIKDCVLQWVEKSLS